MSVKLKLNCSSIVNKLKKNCKLIVNYGKRMTQDQSLKLDIQGFYRDLTGERAEVVVTNKEARIGDICVLAEANIYETLKALRAKVKIRVKSTAYDS